MAQLKKRYKTYWVYVTKSKEHIATFRLGNISKDVAIVRHKSINNAEHLIKDGILVEENFVHYFPWLNEKGTSELVLHSLKSAIDEFLNYKKETIRESSFLRIRISMDRFKEVIKPTMPIKYLKTKHIVEFQKQFKGVHTLTGININLTNIRTFCRWCYDMEYIDRVPKIVIHKPYIEPKYISEEDCNRLLNSVKPFYKRVFELYLFTGKRRSELIEGELKGNILHISKDVSKTHKKHSIKLESYQIQIIKELHKKRDDFLSKGGKLYNFKNYFTKEFKKACIRLGIDGNLHSLRHTFAVKNYLITGSLKEVSQLLNHTQQSTTEGYSKYDKNDLEFDFPQASQVHLEVEKLREKAISDRFTTDNKQLN